MVPMAQFGGGYGGYYNDEVRAAPSVFPSSIALRSTRLGAGGSGQRSQTDLSEPDLSAQPNKAAEHAFNYYVEEKELDPVIAAGIVGNLYQESRLKPHITNKIGAFGVAQWLGGRKEGWFNYADKHGVAKNDLNAQLDYVISEPGEGSRALSAMQKARSAGEAAQIFANVYERMGKSEANYPVRMGVAENLFRRYQGGNLPRSQYGGIPSTLNQFQALQEGGEYMMTPGQLQFFLAHGGEVEFL
jgi:hypothetical protein